MGITFDFEGAKGHRPEIADEQAAEQGLTQTGEDFDDFHCAKAADHARDGAKNRELALPVRRGCAAQTRQTRGLPRQDGRNLRLQLKDGAFD
jgi:hypothetical protein